jgi:hypothetical protein
MSIEKDLEVLNEVKKRIKKSKTVQNMFKESDVSLDIIDLVPMCFGDLEVSARTQHGIIVFNKKLKEKPEEIDHYMVHELTHILQQCFSDGPTQGSNNEDYLDNPYEQEGFQKQTKFLSETDGDHAAEHYINQVLDHHEVPKSERKEKKDELLTLASSESRRSRLLEHLEEQLPSSSSVGEMVPSRDALRITSDMLERMTKDPDYRERVKVLIKEDERQRLIENPEEMRRLEEEQERYENQIKTNREGAAGLQKFLDTLPKPLK